MSDRPKWPWITLIAFQLIQILSFMPWLMLAGFAVMVFDGPGSENLWRPWLVVMAIWSYPVWLLLADVVAWILFKFRKYVAAVILCGVVTLPIPLFMALIIVIYR